MFKPRFHAFIILVALSPAICMAQTDTGQPLAEVQQLRDQADAAQAATLAPGHYARGIRALEKAEKDLASGRDMERVRKSAGQARLEFLAALQQTEQARNVLADGLASRGAANDAEAFRLAPDDWQKAERTLFAAARQLENGKQEKAAELGAKASGEYRQAELKAIKARILTSARRAIAEARQARADRFAPRGFATAQSLLEKAEATLDTDRYNTGEAETLAETASYEARHAIRVSQIAQRIRSGDLNVEDLVLEWEGTLRRLADLANQPADFSRGYASTRDAIAGQLERVPQLEQELGQRNQQVTELEEEIHELDQRLNVTSAERRALMRELQARARLREQFAAVEDMFKPDEAIVLRNGNSLILRLTGLQFRSGSARLDDHAKALLKKLRDAVNIFPRSRITVEGHTDASGQPAENLDLSERRATAVASYLRTQLGIEGYRLKSVGYGDTRPIATNRSAKGRAQNRRIDILLEPQPGSIG
ncbi:MAG TPA: hypothetical protein ENK16_08205 [Chromatiales bacterium]|nr:hypothetical protein [Chromatiales bacterium]